MNQQDPRKPSRPDQNGIYVCYTHKDEAGEPFTTTSRNAFTDHIMQVHNEPDWKILRAERERKKFFKKVTLKI